MDAAWGRGDRSASGIAHQGTTQAWPPSQGQDQGRDGWGDPSDPPYHRPPHVRHTEYQPPPHRPSAGPTRPADDWWAEAEADRAEAWRIAEAEAAAEDDLIGFSDSDDQRLLARGTAT